MGQGFVHRMAQANLISGAGKAVGANTAPTALFYMALIDAARRAPHCARSSQAGDLRSAAIAGCMSAFYQP
jgi:hypothetical protein